MKIIEFDNDAEAAAKRGRQRPSGSDGAPAVKVVEFDDGGGPPSVPAAGRRRPAGQRIATPDSVGPIKVKEFGAEDPAGRPRSNPEATVAKLLAAPAPGKIKIVEFGKEERVAAVPPPPGGKKMKIVEF